MLNIENVIGQKIYEEVIDQAEKTTRVLDLSEYAVGIYFIIIKDQNEEFRQKILFDKN
jgi:hypothetical protein